MTIAVRNRQRRLQVNTRQLRQLAHAAVAAFRDRRNNLAQLSLVFVDDRQMADLNLRYHHTPGPTDILTFDYGETAELIISVEHADKHARRYRTTAARELALYVVHGLLHLHGYDDCTAAQRRRMRAAERRLLGRCSSRKSLKSGNQ